MSPYAASKTAAEDICYAYHRLHDIDVTVLRYFTVYGPAGRPDMSPFRFVKWISDGQTVTVYGDGTQRRDFAYVDDIARGTVLALKPLGYEVVNLGSDKPIALSDAIRVIENATGKKAAIEYGPWHSADVRSTWADIKKAERLLGWRPETTLETGIERMVEWYRENHGWASTIETH